MRNYPSMQLSEAVQSIPPAMSIFINQIVYDLKRAGEDVITLSLGEAFFDIPLFDFNKIDVAKSYHYSDSQGIPELRAKIAEHYTQHYRAPVDGTSEVLISAGSKPVIYMAMLTGVNPGESVLIHEPAWLSYQEQARLVGAQPVFIPFDCPPHEFERHLTPKTRMLVINNPNNPAGRLYSGEDLEQLYKLCRERGIYVLVDEAYSDFVLGEPFVSMAEVAPDKEGVIIVNSLSKNMGMSGWRIGYAISNPTFIASLLKVNQHVITCAPTILLYYCAKYFDDILAITLPQVRQVVEKREHIGAIINDLGLERLGGESTFYFFVDTGKYPGTSVDFALQLLLEKFIAVVPGSAYGASTDRFIRVSIGTESEERIHEALLMIKELTETDKVEREALIKKLSRVSTSHFEKSLQ